MNTITAITPSISVSAITFKGADMNINDVPAMQAIIKNLNQQADHLEEKGYSGLSHHIDMIVMDIEYDIEQAVMRGPLVERQRR